MDNMVKSKGREKAKHEKTQAQYLFSRLKVVFDSRLFRKIFSAVFFALIALI